MNQRPEWNKAANEEKENSHYFTHPVQGTTNSHPISTKEKEWGREKKKETHTGSKKKKTKEKTGGKLKEGKLVKLN